MASKARHVDGKVIFVWMAPTLVGLLTLWLIGSLIYIILPQDFQLFNLSKLAFPLAFFAAILIFAVAPLYFWMRLTYENFTYELMENDLVVREGVLTRKSSVIPYAKIQDISSERTLFERTLGLATVEIETAGVHHSRSDVVIPGVANKDELISEILAIVESKKQKAASEPDMPTQEQLLAGILKELKTLSSKFDTLAHRNMRSEPGAAFESAFAPSKRK